MKGGHVGWFGAGRDVIRLGSLWGEGERGGKRLLARLSTDIALPVRVQVPAVHTVMNGVLCREETQEQVDEQPPEVTVVSGLQLGGQVWASVLVGVPWVKLVIFKPCGQSQDHLGRGACGCPQAVVIQRQVAGRINT